MATASSAAAGATPSSSRRTSNIRRQSHAPSQTPQPSTSGGGRVLALPSYEAQVAELNATGKRALQGFANSATTRHLKTHLDHAAKALTGNAGEINDRLTDARERCEKRRRKREKRGEGDGEDEGGEMETGQQGDDDEEGQRRIDELDTRVRGTTEKMEEKVRGVVDSEARIDALMEILGETSREEPERRTRRTRREHNEDAEDDGDEERENQDENEQIIPASRVLDTRLSEKKDSWNELSLTERYSTHNTYIGFKRMVHESQHPGDNIPPLPHSSTWFSHLEEAPPEAEPSQTPSRRNKRKHMEGKQRQQREDAEEEEEEEEVNPEPDDVAINSEKASLQCPITLLRFKDPITSTKCPHSFERQAIEDMIKRGGSSHRGGKRQAGVRGRVQCPVCTVQLTLNDLRTDPVLVRRVRRANEMDARDDEDDDDGGDEAGEEGEDVMLEAERRRKKSSLAIKPEKTRSPSRERSMVPDTQFEAVSDDDDDDEA